MKPAPPAIREPSSFILRSTVRLLFVALNLFAGYLTLKGHNNPGGGFIGGLVSSLSLVLVAMVLGVEEAQRLVRVDPMRLTVMGLLFAYGASAGPALFGHPFLQHFAWNLQVPGFGRIHLLTAQIFDFGVFFVVVGVVSKMVFSFSLSVQLKNPLGPDERERYAAPQDEPIEDAAWEAQAPGLGAGDRPDGDGEPKPLRTVGRLSRRWRAD
jgi:multisubunit Na+/H+ antiporter MnhB subunit